MSVRVKVIDVELSHPLEDYPDLEGFTSAQVLVRLHGAPIGQVRTPLRNGSLDASALMEAILDNHSEAILRHHLFDALSMSPSERLSLEDLFKSPHCNRAIRRPLVTIAVCSRDRTDDLRRCLDSLRRLDYPEIQLLVVDNSPTDDSTCNMVRAEYPEAHYVCEQRPGLNWARNRAIEEARGEIIAYIDDDAVADTRWVSALARIFVEDPSVMAVTGLVVPYELETEAQSLFERYGGFGRGFHRRWYRVDVKRGELAATRYAGAGMFGTGTNMAYRLSVFDLLGRFDPALDVGTPTNGGGDLDMFFRVLKEGHMLVYEPGAVVCHRHRREYSQLRTQLTNNGIGLYSYLTRSAIEYKDERAAFIKMGIWWFWWWNLRRLLISFLRPGRFPRDLILAELRGSLTGLSRYRKSRRIAARISDSFLSPAEAEESEPR
jgi:glycosyltransferase involved in cell wall biosynthesis